MRPHALARPLAVLLAAVLALAALLYAAPPAAAATDCTRWVATTGADTNQGTQTAPWRNVLESLNKLTPGAVLCVQPGTYTQEVVDGTLPDGTPTSRITVKSADPNNRALLDGKFSLSGLDYWTIRDLRFTNPTPTANNNVEARIVAFLNGSNVLFEGNEVFDSRYSGLLIGRSSASSSSWPMNYTVRGNYIHDTDYANFYFNPGVVSSGHLIERNILANAGSENLKVGWGDNCTGYGGTNGYGAGGTTVLRNTMVNAGTAGNLIIAEPGGKYPVRADRNLMVDVDSVRGFHVRYDSATATSQWPSGCLGDNAEVDNTWAYGTRPGSTTQIPFSEDFDDAPKSQARESGTVTGTNPKLDADYVPTVPAAQAYGHTAP